MMDMQDWMDMVEESKDAESEDRWDGEPSTTSVPLTEAPQNDSEGLSRVLAPYCGFFLTCSTFSFIAFICAGVIFGRMFFFRSSSMSKFGAAGFLSFAMGYLLSLYLEYISSVQRVNKYTICLGFVAINAK